MTVQHGRAAARARRRLRLRRGRGHERPPTRPGSGNTGTVANATWVGGRQVRQRALASTATNELGHRSRLGHARPDDRDDARGAGCTRPRRHDWRTADLQGAAGQPRLRAVREHRTRPAARRRSSSAAPTGRSNGTAQLPAEHVDAPRRHLRRREPAALRERRAGRAARASPGTITTSNGRAADRRQQRSGPSGSTALIDEVRVYNRALTAPRSRTTCTGASRPTRRRPPWPRRRRANGATGIHVGTVATATFNEAMDPASITTLDVRAARRGERSSRRR